MIGSNSIVKCLLFAILIASISSCNQPQPEAQSEPSQVKSVARAETQLVLNNAILEQSNAQGNISWKIKSQSTIYSEDKQRAKLEVVTGNLLQNDQVILKVKGDRGEIQDNGNVILLQDNIVAIDTRNGTVVNSDALEWRPSENILIINQNLTGSNSSLEVTANTGKYFSDQQTLQLQGEVLATALEPSIQLKSELITWNIPTAKITSDTSLEMIRYQGEIVTDRLLAETGQVNLQNHLATVNKNIELISLRPQLQIATDSLAWNYQTRLVSSETPIQIVDRPNQLTVTGNQGEIDFVQEVARLAGGIKGINNSNSAQLYGHQLIWNLTTQIVEVIDNVWYRQLDPQVELTGDHAEGNLQTNKIKVSSDRATKKQVISVISDP